MPETDFTTLIAAVSCVVGLLVGAGTIVAIIRRPLVKQIGELKHDNRLHFVERGDVSKRVLVVETRLSNGIPEALRDLKAALKELNEKLDVMAQNCIMHRAGKNA